MIQSPIVFLSICSACFMAGQNWTFYDWTVYPYLPKLCTAIYRSCAFLFTETRYSYLPISVYCYLPITTNWLKVLNVPKIDNTSLNFWLGCFLSGNVIFLIFNC